MTKGREKKKKIVAVPLPKLWEKKFAIVTIQWSNMNGIVKGNSGCRN